MRRWLVVPLLVAAAGMTLDPPPAPGQVAVKPDQEAFNTADGVKLKGLFHKSPNAGNPDKPGKGAVVVLLYPPGPDRTMLKPGDWDGLIDKLTDAGYHVFRFDWRGHGQSTDIENPVRDNGFWVNQITGPLNAKFVRGATKRPPKTDIRVKTDIISHPGYLPVYVTDLAAVRLHLDTKNDQNDLNTSSIYVIGAGDAAGLGMMWLASEWDRPAFAPALAPPAFPAGSQYKLTPTPGVKVDPPAGADIAGCIWLSGSKPSSIPDEAIKAWVVREPRLREQNKMLFLYGETDKAAKKDTDYLFNKVLVADGEPRLSVRKVEQTFARPVAKTGLNGLALLGKDKDTQVETNCLEYLAARQKDRLNLGRKERKYVSSYFVDVNYYMTMKLP